MNLSEAAQSPTSCIAHMKNVESNGRKTSREKLVSPAANEELDSRGRHAVGRRSFLKGIGMAGATLLPASSLVMTEAKAERTDKG